jgi:nucleoside-diphosphate-sugar epimerase
VVLGGSGAAGSALVRELIMAPDVTEIKLVVRRRAVSAFEGFSKVKQYVVNDNKMEAEITGDGKDVIAFMLAGVGTARNVSRSYLQTTELGLATTFGQSARAKGVAHFFAMTAILADSSSPDSGETTAGGSGTYNQIKGMVEDALVALSFPGSLRIFRPAIILGTPHTPAVLATICPIVNPVLPPKFRCSSVRHIALGMLAEARNVWNVAATAATAAAEATEAAAGAEGTLPTTRVLHVPEYTAAAGVRP